MCTRLSNTKHMFLIPHLPFGVFLLEVLPMLRCILFIFTCTEIPNYAGSNDCEHGLEGLADGVLNGTKSHAIR